MIAVEKNLVIEPPFGREAGVVEFRREIEVETGYSRYRDPPTRDLGLRASAWDSLHKAWQAMDKRAKYGSPQLQIDLAGYADALMQSRDRVGRGLAKTMKRHPLWPWLKAFPGVRGVHTARLISMIGDPLRFPGRMCVIGHHLPSDWVGPCPMPVKDEQHHLGDDGEWVVCGTEVGLVRRGTGVRPLWHYCGLHVVDGKLARKRKGVQCTWNPAARTALLQPDGVADQIIRQRTEPWRTKYDETKERVTRERGADVVGEIDYGCGPALHDIEGDADAAREIDVRIGVAGSREGAEADSGSEIEASTGLRPFQVHAIARTVAVKAFVGDLLTAWKEAVE